MSLTLAKPVLEYPYQLMQISTKCTGWNVTMSLTLAKPVLEQAYQLTLISTKYTGWNGATGRPSH